MSPAQRIAELASEAAEAPTAGDALRKVRELRRELDAFEREQVARALSEGANFSKIARDLGVSRQAAHRRFRSLAAGDEHLLASPDVRRLLRVARDEAAALGVDTPEGSHVVLAAVRISELPAGKVLRAAGVTLGRARSQVEALSARGPLFRRETRTEAESLRRLLAAPAREARARGDREIQVEHALIALLDEEDSGAGRTLTALGVDVESVRAELDRLLRAGSAGRQPGVTDRSKS